VLKIKKKFTPVYGIHSLFSHIHRSSNRLRYGGMSVRSYGVTKERTTGDQMMGSRDERARTTGDRTIRSSDSPGALNGPYWTGQVLGRAESITYGGGMGKSRVDKRTCGMVLVGKYFPGEIKKLPTRQ